MGQLPCPLCQYKTITNFQELQAKISNVLQCSVMCAICNINVEGLSSLHTHLGQHLPTQGTLAPQNSPTSFTQIPDQMPNIESLFIRDEPQKDLVHHHCDVCGLVFASEHFLSMHKDIIHSNSSLFEVNCKICKAKFINLELYRNHVKETHDGERYFCQKCPKSFKVKGGLVVHTKIFHDKSSPSSCNICKKKFTSKGRKELHEKRFHKMDQQNQQNNDTDNNSVSSSTQYPDIALNIDEPYDPLQALTVPYKTGNPTFNSVFSSNIVETLSNDNCQMSFLNTGNETVLNKESVPESSRVLNNLVSTNLPSIPVNQESKKESNLLEFLLCHEQLPQHSESEGFLTETARNSWTVETSSMPIAHALNDIGTNVDQQLSSLLKNTSDMACNADISQKVEIKKTTDNKNWKCDVCKKSFTTKYFLKKHKRLHTGQRPYSCEECGKNFTFQQSYHKHVFYHTNDKPHKCNQCGRSFKEVSTLNNHIRIHTGEKPFVCDTCGKAFRQRVSYLVHQRIHTGLMPYKCEKCNKSFRYKVSLRSHKCPEQLSTDNQSTIFNQNQFSLQNQDPIVQISQRSQKCPDQFQIEASNTSFGQNQTIPQSDQLNQIPRWPSECEQDGLFSMLISQNTCNIPEPCIGTNGSWH